MREGEREGGRRGVSEEGGREGEEGGDSREREKGREGEGGEESVREGTGREKFNHIHPIGNSLKKHVLKCNA